jgi:small subunit ribosomal protein S17
MVEKKEQKQRHALVGEVVSDKMDKTIVVKTVLTYTHPMFQKTMHKVKNYKVHDENETANIGDIVEFYEGRPMSKTKYMYLARIVETRSKSAKQ